MGARQKVIVTAAMPAVTLFIKHIVAPFGERLNRHIVIIGFFGGAANGMSAAFIPINADFMLAGVLRTTPDGGTFSFYRRCIGPTGSIVSTAATHTECRSWVI